MKIKDLIVEILVEQITLDKIREKYVGTGKRVSDEVFKEIIGVAKEKKHLVAWLTVKVGNKIIKEEDIYKFYDYFKTFENNKNEYPFADINRYKTSADVEIFIKKSFEISEREIEYKDIEDSQKYVTPGEIKKLKDQGIIYMGLVDDYQVFEIPSKLKGNREAYKTYRDILGRCKGRDKGAKVSICTISNPTHFDHYFSKFPGSSYFIAFNLSDPNSPYQIHFESKQFRDRRDVSVEDLSKHLN